MSPQEIEQNTYTSTMQKNKNKNKNAKQNSLSIIANKSNNSARTKKKQTKCEHRLNQHQKTKHVQNRTSPCVRLLARWPVRPHKPKRKGALTPVDILKFKISSNQNVIPRGRFRGSVHLNMFSSYKFIPRICLQ